MTRQHEMPTKANQSAGPCVPKNPPQSLRFPCWAPKAEVYCSQNTARTKQLKLELNEHPGTALGSFTECSAQPAPWEISHRIHFLRECRFKSCACS